MKKVFDDHYTDEDVRNLLTIAFLATIFFGIMTFISSYMGIYL